MDLKILSKKEEPLLSRTKVEAEVSFDKTTPSKSEVKKALVEELGKEEKLIVVNKIYTVYGIKKAKNLAYAYENEEIMKAIEPKPKVSEKKEAAKEETKESPKAEEKKQ